MIQGIKGSQYTAFSGTPGSDIICSILNNDNSSTIWNIKVYLGWNAPNDGVIKIDGAPIKVLIYSGRGPIDYYHQFAPIPICLDRGCEVRFFLSGSTNAGHYLCYFYSGLKLF